MIGKFLAKVFRTTKSRRRPSSSRKSSSIKRARRIGFEPLESRTLLSVTTVLPAAAYLNSPQIGTPPSVVEGPQSPHIDRVSADVSAEAATGIVSGFAYLNDGTGFGGLTVQLENTAASSTPELAQTGADGSYSFSSLAAGAYQVQLVPPATVDESGDSTSVTLTDGQDSTDNNFTGLQVGTGAISLRMYLASTGTLSQYLTAEHAPPTVATGVSGTPATYTTGGSPLTLASSATIAAADSPTLTSMTVSIQNLEDGRAPGTPGREKLSATTSSPLTSSYSDGVLTISGVADVSTYQAVLQSVAYSDTASPATAGDRTIAITVNDGTATSTPVDVTINVVQGVNVTPAVTSVSPTSGPLAGGTSVTILGTGFSGATAVDFGTVAATNLDVVSTTQITATSPAEAAGTVDVTVQGPGGTLATSSADQFTYVAAPAVTAISPAAGPTNGGTAVTITGSGFTGATAVDFGTVAATNLDVVSDTEVTATSPAGTGTVDVTVTTPGGESATSTADEFTYMSVTAVSPSAGPLAGGTTVTITGTGFTARRRLTSARMRPPA